MKRSLLLIAAALLFTGVASAQTVCGVTNPFVGYVCPADGTTGVTANDYVKWNSAGTAVVLGATSDTLGIVGVADQTQVGGTVLIHFNGPVVANFDGTTTAGHCFTYSPTTAGQFHDQATATCTAVSLGQITGAHTGSGLAPAFLNGPNQSGTASGGNCTVAGSSGDVQMNNGASGCSASHLNDNATILVATEPLSAGTGYFSTTKTAAAAGVTANLLVSIDTTGNVINSPTSGVDALGIAATTATSGNPVQVATRGIINGVADNTTVVGNMLIVGTGTAGRVRDSGQASATGICNNVQIIGKALAVATVGNAVSVQLYGPGNFGAQVCNAGILNTTIDVTSKITGLVPNANTSASIRASMCEPGLGDGLNAITAATYLQSTCVNEYGATYTITGIWCFSDNAGTSTLSVTNGAGTALLTGAITCSNSTILGAAGTQSGTTTIANADGLKFTFVADGTTKQTNWTVAVTR